MFTLNDNDKLKLKFIIVIVVLGLGLAFGKFYQPHAKTVRIYKNALKDYNNSNYSNAYYLFSKVNFASPLKPAAIYRQALCAKALADQPSEIRNYQALFNTYPKFKLSNEARYLAAQLLVEDNPTLAYKYFNKVVKSNIDEDFKVASEYYKARITASKIRYSGKKSTGKKSEQVEAAFRNYLTKYPQGRLAQNVASTWKKFNPELTSKDSVLAARAYYYGNNCEEANRLLSKAKKEDGWAISAMCAYSTFDYLNTKSIVEDGVANHAEDVLSEDYISAVDKYVDLFDGNDKYRYILKLSDLTKGKDNEYIINLKCGLAPESEKHSCYTDFYTKFPQGKYAQNALLQMLILEVNQKNFALARSTATKFMSNFNDSENMPYVMFWAGKIEQKYRNPQLATKYYQSIINKYPDSYYAYRAYWLLKGVNSAVINPKLDYKPVVFPYQQPAKNDILYALMEVKDYDLLIKYTKDDFIKSWVEYERGNYAKSLVLARDAMEKIKNKPIKSDLRWRLVYPQNYYKQVKNYADQYKNNAALMMAIIREESSFNYEAQSDVGAIGLMQLMPSTAHDIGAKNGIELNTSYLFNPELNIRLGNLYYSTIKQMLEGKDVSAIAAYNGGIGSVSKWKTTLTYNDTDEFVEQIPYPETKNYVFKVFKSYWNYTRIYQHR